MFWAIIAACLYVSVRLVRDEAQPIFFKQKDPVIRQFKYEYEARKLKLKEEYEKTNLPKSGYMLREDYEKESKGIPRMELEISDAKRILPSNMKYIPEPSYKLVRYNNPPGSPELNIPRKLNFDRQINAQGIVSGDFTMLVYPSIYYYADSNCTSCSVFMIPLDDSLSKLERVKRANVARKVDKPLFETDKDISTEGAFRTITPIDFSEDNRYIVAKEKIGWVHDGIWKTNVWIHDFQSHRSWELPEVREAIVNYWHNATGVDLDEQRWDIYPLGFDKNNQERILVCAYAYTGDIPAFLGTWGADITGEKCELVDLEGTNYSVSTVGFKLVFDKHESRDWVEWDSKRQAKIEKHNKKIMKRQSRQRRRAHKKVYRYKKRLLKAEYRQKLKAYKMSKKKGFTSQGGEDRLNIDVNSIDNGQDMDYEKFNKERNELIRKQQEELEAAKKRAKGKNKKTKEQPNKTDNQQTITPTEQTQTQSPNSENDTTEPDEKSKTE